MKSAVGQWSVFPLVQEVSLRCYQRQEDGSDWSLCFFQVASLSTSSDWLPYSTHKLVNLIYRQSQQQELLPSSSFPS